jgi:type IV/VI secretion system ImpK/VasF family protein
LSIALLGDPEGGVNFFRKLEQLREDQTEVMKIYLFCLALGYRGMHITEDVRKREATIEKIKKELHRRIGERAMESMERLFPDAYTPCQGVEDEVEPPPSWWVWASIGVVVGSILLWMALYWLAGRSPQSARDAIDDFALAPIAAPGDTEGSRC